MAQQQCGCHNTREDESVHKIYTESVAEWDQALVSRAAASVIASASFNTTCRPLARIALKSTPSVRKSINCVDDERELALVIGARWDRDTLECAQTMLADCAAFERPNLSECRLSF
jgi:hypothetical protein